MNRGVVILGAGASSRMGRSKLLLPWKGTSIIGHLISRWRQLGGLQIALVLPPADRALEDELNQLKFPTENRILNPDPARGMFSSIRCAAAWTGWRAPVTDIAIILGDQPHLRLSTLSSLLEFSDSLPGKICQPSYGGRPKHPVLLPRLLFKSLLGEECETLAQFLRLHKAQVELLEIEDEGLARDLDTPADYEEALRKNPD